MIYYLFVYYLFITYLFAGKDWTLQFNKWFKMTAANLAAYPDTFDYGKCNLMNWEIIKASLVSTLLSYTVFFT
jgi:hypothetical protein